MKNKLMIGGVIAAMLYAGVAYIGHVSAKVSDTAWRLGCTSTGASPATCVALQEQQQ